MTQQKDEVWEALNKFFGVHDLRVGMRSTNIIAGPVQFTIFRSFDGTRDRIIDIYASNNGPAPASLMLIDPYGSKILGLGLAGPGGRSMWTSQTPSLGIDVTPPGDWMVEIKDKDGHKITVLLPIEGDYLKP